MSEPDTLNRLLRSLERKTLRAADFCSKIFALVHHAGAEAARSALRLALDALIDLRARDVISSDDFWHCARTLCDVCPSDRARLLHLLSTHENEHVREFAGWLADYCRTDEQSRDFDFLRRHSVLQPGTRLELYGGYTAAYAPPHWLQGRERYLVTFLGFAAPQVGSVPLAVVELDEAIDLPPAQARTHAGKFALLSVARGFTSHTPPSLAWSNDALENVAVHVVPAPPDDVDALADGYALLPSTESHASYALVPEPPSASTVLVTAALELRRAIDLLEDESTADLAISWLRVLLWREPALFLLAAPSLLRALAHRGGSNSPPTQAAAQAIDIALLFQSRGAPGLKFLARQLPQVSANQQLALLAALANFGTDAVSAVPHIERLLQAASPVPIAAAMALWRIAGRTEGLGPLLVEGLKFEALANDAVEILRTLGPEAGDLVPALGQLLEHGGSACTRAQAASALGGQGHLATAAVEQLVAALNDADATVRRSAQVALREMAALADFSEFLLTLHARGELAPPRRLD